jgi:hypothetical protein
MLRPVLFLRHRFSPEGKFKHYVTSPFPKSVRVKFVDSNAHILNPEPVVHMSFSASAEALNEILKMREAKPYAEYAIGSGAGPRWFQPAVSTNGLRQYQLRGRINRIPEFLWIDQTGTNAYYLLFGV